MLILLRQIFHQLHETLEMEDHITQSTLTLKQRYQWQNVISRKIEQDFFTKLILTDENFQSCREICLQISKRRGFFDLFGILCFMI